jgi:hypothetical protein
MTIEELLAQVLRGGPQPVNRMAGNWNGPDSEPNRLMQPQAGPPAAMAPQGATMAGPQQNAPVAAPRPSGGGLLSRLFGGGANDDENYTVNWLTKQGIDLGTATMMARHKPSLQAYLLERSQGGDPMKALQAEKLGLEIEQMREPDAPSLVNAGDGNLYDPVTKEWIRAPKAAGGEFRFEGTSVEAQALNGLMDSGALTADQAQQLAAGKTVTNPADGSIIFLTPRGIFSQPAGGGPAQPVGQPGAVPAAPADAAALPPGAPVPAPAPVDPSARPGIIPLTEGKPGKLATESETRNRALYTVAAPDLKIALDNFSALENVYSQAASRVLPWGLDNMATSPQYQQARNAMRTIIATYLYSTSGATANPGEVENQISVLMPAPGEAPESVADKRARLKTMVDAIRQAGGNWKPPEQEATKPGPDVDVTTMPPPEGMTPEIWKFVPPEKRKLWLQ